MEDSDKIRETVRGGWSILGHDERPWWWPVPTDDKWLQRIREDYPEDAQYSDEYLRDQYADGREWQVLWDHTGDAYTDYKKMVEAFAHLLRVAEAAREIVTEATPTYEGGGVTLNIETVERLREALEAKSDE